MRKDSTNSQHRHMFNRKSFILTLISNKTLDRLITTFSYLNNNTTDVVMNTQLQHLDFKHLLLQ